jgi:hypothetical protein
LSWPEITAARSVSTISSRMMRRGGNADSIGASSPAWPDIDFSSAVAAQR